MSHPVIPAPVRFDGDGDEFVFRSRTRVANTDAAVAPIVERCCSEATRRTGLRALPMAGNPGASGPSVRVELARAWSDPRLGGWSGHRERLARHGRLWAQDDLASFRTSAVDWR